MLRNFGFTLSLTILALAFAAAPSQAAQTGARALVTQPVNNSQLVTLAGNTRPEAVAANDRGKVADSFAMEHLQLLLQRPPEVEQALVQFIDQLHDAKSANYHKWLSATELGQKYGPAASDIKAVTDWLKSQGFAVNFVYANNMMIDFSGNAGLIRQAFGAEIHNLNVNGVQHIANMRDPQVPAALSAVVKGVLALHDFRPFPMYVSRAQFTISSTEHALVPADVATIYNFNPLFTGGTSGQGQTIVLIEDTDVYSPSDWTTFRSKFGLSSFTGATLTQVHPAPSSGPNNCSAPGVNPDDAEAELDVEWASAAAPSAKIEVAACRDTASNFFGGLVALVNLLNQPNPPPVISMSYGDCETRTGATINGEFNTVFQQAAAEGVSVFVSSGDQLAAVCDRGATAATHGIGVNGWGSTPYNVSVGGTDFDALPAGTLSTYWNSTNTSTYGSAKSYIPEIPWNNSCGSVVDANYWGASVTYGASGWCNSSSTHSHKNTDGGSGGPSGCATGSPSTSLVVSGTCAGYPKPSWQSVFGNPSDGVRDLPDVSLFASNGFWGTYYVACYSDRQFGGSPCTGSPANWAGFGGTSISSPIMAGIQALVDQKHGRQGNPNVRYYALAAAEYGASGSASCNSSNGNAVGSSCVFYDVTLGDIVSPCTGSHNCYLPSGTYGVLSTNNSAYAPAYATTPGWDFATGIGAVNATNLVNNW